MEQNNPATPSGRPESSLPDLRSLYEWVDTIPLSRPRRNLARDFSDAVLAAEVAGFLWPEAKLFGCGSGGGGGGNSAVPAFQPANSTSGKIYNWCVFRERVLRRLRVPATRADVEAAARGEPGAAEWILALLRQRAERGLSVGGSGGPRREAAGAVVGVGVGGVAPTPPKVVRKGGGIDVVSSHSYAPSPLLASSSSVAGSNNNCRGGWRAAALAARIGGGGGEQTPATAAKKTKTRVMTSRREEPPPASEQRTRVLFSSPAAAAAAAATERQEQVRPPPPPPPPSRCLSSPAAALARPPPASSSLFLSPSSLPTPLERENAALRSQVARLERLALRQEAQIEALLEALEDASSATAVAAASSAAAASASPAAAENDGDDGSGEEPPPQEQQKILSSSGSLKLPGGGMINSSFPSSSPLRALEGAVLIGRC